MNPEGIWCNPPPPGTDEDPPCAPVKRERSETPERAIDKIDPFLKSSEYIKYERKLSAESSRRRSPHRRRRSRSRSRGKHRHRRRRYSSSRSRSHSRRRHKRSRHSRSRSKSHKTRKSRRSRSRHRSGSRSRAHREPDEKDIKVEEAVEEEEEEDDTNENAFKNDGSFMEMFKKMQEEQLKQKVEAEKAETGEPRPPLPAFGKRRGGKVLKTGMVQKSKTEAQDEGEAQDAWTLYMKEVKRYKDACCDDDSKTRLLVK